MGGNAPPDAESERGSGGVASERSGEGEGQDVRSSRTATVVRKIFFGFTLGQYNLRLRIEFLLNVCSVTRGLLIIHNANIILYRKQFHLSVKFASTIPL